ncbi:hybrid sensor histidine kinase/response regulator [Vibrio renipiscarius]|uniref:histidine kinase n=1 Tax=Vibrio renipiscarius TaxID=1461322 RepID=A0A0C2NUE0_9VIBR|nr:hybrid sensor histidine kinase/response regulator [Vibrio renipiscarius]KII76693.1 chemotaxis protein CheY [Vibrio renipiscarius]KII77787.1 chemotaxis protein CheY [Vibrio renipiscarius]
MDSVRKVYQYAEPNLTVMGWMGFLGFPMYYYVWAQLFPQNYESLPLRLFCSLLFLVIALRHYVPVYLQRYLPAYFAICVPICLPFFFSYMMFKNDWSTVWVMSFMAAILIHILIVYRTFLVMLQTIIAVTCSLLVVYGANLSLILGSVVWAYVPIFLFTYVFGNLFYLRNQTEYESRVSLAKSFGAGIAHEMRNPLSAVKATLDVLESLLPKSKGQGDEPLVFDPQALSLAHEVLQDANEAIRSGTETIDLLLTSIDQNRITNATYRKHSMREVVEQTLASFSYPSKVTKESMRINLEQDFFFFGSDTLLKYTLYNLLKNAFYYGLRDNFVVSIELKRLQGHNQLIVRDNGVGMSPDVRKLIFEDFYTHGKAGGYGLGLPFCYKVMQAMGGSIRCRSELNQFAEFTLSFPPYCSGGVSQIKLDMMKSKSILYIGSSNIMMRTIEDCSFYQGFKFTQLSIQKALAREEFEFEFEVLLVDIDEQMLAQSVLEALEKKLSFTEGRIVYLYNKSAVPFYERERSVEFYPVEKRQLLSQCGKTLDELCFESPKASRKLDNHETSFQGKTLLIADDNQSFRAYTAILMQQYGFNVLQAQDGQEVLSLLTQVPVNLIVMDIEMPTMDGIVAARAIRAAPHPFSQTPIIAYSGDSSHSMAERIKAAGINDFLVKPANSDSLLKKVAKWL